MKLFQVLAVLLATLTVNALPQGASERPSLGQVRSSPREFGDPVTAGKLDSSVQDSGFRPKEQGRSQIRRFQAPAEFGRESQITSGVLTVEGFSSPVDTELGSPVPGEFEISAERDFGIPETRQSGSPENSSERRGLQFIPRVQEFGNPTQAGSSFRRQFNSMAQGFGSTSRGSEPRRQFNSRAQDFETSEQLGSEPLAFEQFGSEGQEFEPQEQFGFLSQGFGSQREFGSLPQSFESQRQFGSSPQSFEPQEQFGSLPQDFISQEQFDALPKMFESQGQVRPMTQRLQPQGQFGSVIQDFQPQGQFESFGRGQFAQKSISESDLSKAITDEFRSRADRNRGSSRERQNRVF
ncbi:uncharacterized protein [Periplaneta americana]|uniref:uncharacterized protein n=1 Tax=Periplaneta americana TaxID=6978 RepID=UPI0037E860DA